MTGRSLTFLAVPGLCLLILVSACSPGGAKNAGNSNAAPKSTAVSPVDNKPVSNGNADVPVTRSKTPAINEGPGGRLRFAKGADSTTLSGAVIRGERAEYLVGARHGQTMTVTITSLENNAVFQIEDPSGRYLGKAADTDDATNWTGPLPADGDYKIIVGGTRGNAEFHLTVSIK